MGEAGAVVHRVDMRRRPHSPRNALAAAQLLTVARRVRPAVVHGHSSVGGALGRIVSPAVRAAAVYTPNGVRADRATVALERRFGRLTDVLVAVSPSEAALAADLGMAPAERIRVVPNGIPLEQPPPHDVDLRAALGIPAEAEVVGCIARLVPQKAPADAVACLAALARRRPHAHLVLIGSGPLRADVDDARRRHGVADRVHVVPFLEQAAAAMPQFDALLLTSRFEGCPYVVLEAYRAGVPVVASDVVGTGDVIEHERTGLLVPFGDVDRFGAALDRVLGDPALSATLVEGGRARLRRDHDVALMGERMTDVYRDAVARRR
jgi:glycosyltransferase involved in cell wall biosynthesis